MKATGIVRRMDDLGRIVIPKELRRSLHIRSGDPLEIYTDDSGAVIFQKYSMLREIATAAQGFAETLCRVSGLAAAVCDTERIVSTAGLQLKGLAGQPLSEAMVSAVSMRRMHVYMGAQEAVPLCADAQKKVLMLSPVIAQSDIAGAVVLVRPETDYTPTDADSKLLVCASLLLGQSLE